MYRTLGWAALCLFAAANVPFWLQILCGIKAKKNRLAYLWTLGSFTVLGALTVFVSVAFFGGWLLHRMQAWSAVLRWSLTLLACMILLGVETCWWLILCVALNFGGM